MQDGGTCRECGGEVPADARTMGLCPRCLLARVLDVRRSVRVQMDRLRPEVRAPAPEELANVLPQIEVIELLAVGGMGAVYRARQSSLDREVALKIVPVADVDEELASRFTAEARILAGLNHPNIVVAYESGRTSEYLYLTMELVSGPSLRTVLKKGPMPWRAAVELLSQVCDALAYAHQRQVIHRDIKPENILLDPGGSAAEAGIEQFLEQGGRARLADFGLARSLSRGRLDLSLTAPQHLVGTADYIAPECRMGKPATERSDLYAAGVVLYEILTGARPVGHFAMPRKVARSPAALDGIVRRCLASDPGERYSDALALKRDLERVLHPSVMPRVIAAAAMIAVAASVLSGTWHYAQKPRGITALTTRPAAVVTDTTPAPPRATIPAAVPQALPGTPATQTPATEPVQPDPSAKTDGADAEPGIAVEVPNGPPGLRGPMMPYFSGAMGGPPKAENWGPEYTITIMVEGVKDWQAEEIQRELKGLIKSGSWSTSHSGDVVKITVAPFADLDAFVKQIGFASVASIDREKRIVKMHCTLPTTLPAAEIKPMSAGEVAELSNSALVLVKQGDGWIEATVVAREGRRVKVHYAEDSGRADEWVGVGRLAWRP